jgi:hypothetical protein
MSFTQRGLLLKAIGTIMAENGLSFGAVLDGGNDLEILDLLCEELSLVTLENNK